MKLKNLVAGCLALTVLAGCSSGQKAPDVTLFRLGETTGVKLSEHRGKVVLIDVWATWCGPCRETMPMIQKLYDEKGPQGLMVAAVSGESAPTVEKFVKQHGYTYPFYIDLDNSVNQGFGVQGLPTSIVIDKQGNVVFFGHPADTERLHSAIDEALKG